MTMPATAATERPYLLERVGEAALVQYYADGFEARWQVAETPGEWKDDVRVVYRRRSA